MRWREWYKYVFLPSLVTPCCFYLQSIQFNLLRLILHFFISLVTIIVFFQPGAINLMDLFLSFLLDHQTCNPLFDALIAFDVVPCLSMAKVRLGRQIVGGTKNFLYLFQLIPINGEAWHSKANSCPWLNCRILRLSTLGRKCAKWEKTFSKLPSFSIHR